MDIFRYVTPSLYWFLALIWTYILFFLIRKKILLKKTNKVISILIIVLSINAFRTMVESFFFSVWSTSLSGFIPADYHQFLTRPEILILPKILNVIAALTIVFILLRRWFPAEEHERIKLNQIISESQDEIKEKELFNKTILNTSPDIFCIYDISKKKLIYCNQAVTSILGYEINEINKIDTSLLQSLIHPNIFDKYISQTDKPIYSPNEEDLKKNKFQIQHKNGHMLWLYSRELVFKKNTDGHPEQIFAIITDITDREKNEEKLKMSEKYLKLSQQIARIGHYVINLKTGIWICSEILDDIFGIDASYKKDLTGWINLVHKDSREELSTYFRSTIYNNSGLFNKEYQINRLKDDKIIWVRTLGHFEYDASGELSVMYGTVQDITDQKQLEERVFQTEKIEAIGQLAGGVAHDFNNQLTGIVVYTEMLKEALSDNPELTDYVDNILVAAKRSADLTKQLLAFARKGKFLSIRINLHTIIQEVINLLKHTIDKRIVIRKELNAKKPFTLGDPSQIQNALMNLALNARDAMPDGGELSFSTDIITLDTEYCESLSYEITPGQYIRISVTDNGYGIHKEILDKIFEPFFTTKQHGKGTGMGLAAVFGTVKNHGGAINVYSEIGYGTTMKIYLPLILEHDKKKIEKGLYTDNTIKKGNARILFIDDEEFILDSTSIILKQLGYEVVMCRNGDEAVRFYKDNWRKIDLIILDMVMPLMDGETCFRKMKEINSKLKVLLSSGYSINEKAQGLMDEGVLGFLQKPFHKRELSYKIDEILKTHSE